VTHLHLDVDPSRPRRPLNSDAANIVDSYTLSKIVNAILHRFIVSKIIIKLALILFYQVVLHSSCCFLFVYMLLQSFAHRLLSIFVSLSSSFCIVPYSSVVLFLTVIFRTNCGMTVCFSKYVGTTEWQYDLEWTRCWFKF